MIAAPFSSYVETQSQYFSPRKQPEQQMKYNDVVV